MALDVGAYQPLSTARSAPAFSMSSRQKQARTTNIDSPGPAAYTAVSSVGRQVSAALPTQPRTKVGTGPQRVDHSRFWRDNPGPGTYNVPTTVGKVPGATMKSRTYVRPLYTTPSPADYKEESGMGKQVLRRSNPSYSMAGRQPRPHTTDMDAPAPDAYNLEPRSKAYNPLSTQRSNPAFSLRGRKPTVVNQWDSQGPGQCRTDSAFGKQVDGKQRSNPRYTFGYRTGGSSLYQDTGVPGPGTYSHDRPSTAPGATLTSRVRRPVPKVTPAPGDYAEDRATGKQVGSTRRTMPAYTFGTETGRKKGMAKRDGVPGPGECECRAMAGPPGHCRVSSHVACVPCVFLTLGACVSSRTLVNFTTIPQTVTHSHWATQRRARRCEADRNLDRLCSSTLRSQVPVRTTTRAACGPSRRRGSGS